jgi:hypothetical protein
MYISYLGITQRIQTAIRDQKPFSLIRLGDGEYTILKYKKWTTRARCIDRINRWFDAHKLSEKQVVSIRNQILRACQNADLLGMPSRNEIRFYSKWKSFNPICKALKIPLTETFYFHDILKVNFKSIVEGKNLVCITCRNIGNKIQANLNPATLKMILIRPEKFAWNKSLKGQDTRSGRRDHYNDQFEEIYKTITSESQKGKVYLIGAGGLGKSYCNMVKSMGGVAIDIGALFDIWAGVQTRPYLKKKMVLK